ncbi:MAG: PhnD/SsuA/transferrin family substrate-binding protein [Anaerolineae bacterium]|nr:PhnD/SsuA/transferrin family substrate-binding protein [Anaerolineae bacterium]
MKLKIARFKTLLILSVNLFIVMTFGACSILVSDSQSLVTTAPPTFIPTTTIQPKPLGDAENPVVQGIVSQGENQLLTEAGVALSDLLKATTGYTFQTRFFEDYPTLLNEMDQGKIHLAWFPPVTYIYAHQEGFAQVVFLTNHFGVFQYGFQFLANIDSGFIPYYDPALGVNVADATTALQQFAARQPCYVDPTSPSGYILPASLLRASAIDTLPGAMLQNHTAVIRALYIKDICDFGVTFAVSGDPRTSANLQDLPDVTDRIQIIWRSDAVIPNTNLSVLPEIPDEMRTSIITAYQEVARSENGLNLLSTTLQYDVQGLRQFDDSVYTPLMDALKTLETNPATLIGR